MKKRILFLVNGLGLGNSTRCHAVIQYLHEKGAQIEVLTSGNGAWYFQGCPEVNSVHEIEALRYGKRDGRLSVLKTVLSTREILNVQARNAKKVEAVINSFNPEAAVFDSIYTYRPFKKRQIPLIALNNSDVVYHSYYRFRDNPNNIKPQFYAIEMMDYLFHKSVPDLVISPSLEPVLPLKKGKFISVGPIVRKGYAPPDAKKKTDNIVIMLSGSTFASPVILKRRDYPCNISVVGRDAPADLFIPANIKYYGKVSNTLPFLVNADLVVVNGGFSAVSEMFYMKKPMIVIPVPNHAEQWLNARTVKHLGVGVMADESNFEDKTIDAIGRLNDFRETYAKLPETSNGAEEAAEILLTRI
jgi:UDP:flavonoid glycosyltransferase YjiC (YdhE family)